MPEESGEWIKAEGTGALPLVEVRLVRPGARTPTPQRHATNNSAAATTIVAMAVRYATWRVIVFQ